MGVTASEIQMIFPIPRINATTFVKRPWHTFVQHLGYLVSFYQFGLRAVFFTHLLAHRLVVSEEGQQALPSFAFGEGLHSESDHSACLQSPLVAFRVRLCGPVRRFERRTWAKQQETTRNQSQIINLFCYYYYYYLFFFFFFFGISS